MPLPSLSLNRFNQYHHIRSSNRSMNHSMSKDKHRDHQYHTKSMDNKSNNNKNNNTASACHDRPPRLPALRFGKRKNRPASHSTKESTKASSKSVCNHSSSNSSSSKQPSLPNSLTELVTTAGKDAVGLMVSSFISGMRASSWPRAENKAYVSDDDESDWGSLAGKRLNLHTSSSDVSSLSASRATWSSTEEEEEEEEEENANNTKSSSHPHHRSSKRPVYPVVFQKLKDMQQDNDDDEEEVVFDYNNNQIPVVVSVKTQDSESSGCTADIVFDLVRAARVELKGGHVHDQQPKKKTLLKKSTCDDDEDINRNPLHRACDCVVPLPALSAPDKRREEEDEPRRRFRNLRTIYAAKPPDDNNYHDFDELEESFEVTVEEDESPFVEDSFETIDESFELAVDEALNPLESGFDLFFCNAFLRGSSMY